MCFTVLTSFRPHLKNIQNRFKFFLPGKKISLIREKLNGYYMLIGLNLNGQNINCIIIFGEIQDQRQISRTRRENYRFSFSTIEKRKGGNQEMYDTYTVLCQDFFFDMIKL